MNIAVHAVTPSCPRCGRYVRSSVELQAALADLEMDARVVYAQRECANVQSLEEAADIDVAAAELRARLDALEAELQGAHLACGDVVH